MKQVIQITAGDDYLYALDSDGGMWEAHKDNTLDSKCWNKITSLPETCEKCGK